MEKMKKKETKLKEKSEKDFLVVFFLFRLFVNAVPSSVCLGKIMG